MRTSTGSPERRTPLRRPLVCCAPALNRGSDLWALLISYGLASAQQDVVAAEAVPGRGHVVQTAFDESERRGWAGQAHAYAASFAKLCAYPVSALLDAAGVGEGLRVLDVGTGTGTVAALACERGAKVTAVDAEPDMAAQAAPAAPGADVRLAALPQVPFADDEFDATVGNFVLNHVGRISSGNSLELWRLRIRPETELAGVPHATGTIEHLLISSGSVTAGPVDAPQDLGPGDMLAFAGDAPHFYRTGADAVDITVVFASPIST
ncbi:methyltransferase domain-containing protein [Streptomyces sp. NPDC001068]|uniref:methyltransferase domain-containing protein n=1 Tax=Streptomyces sp. NPDC001068 TaxID=3364544 RepID=UPI0036A201EA